MRSRPAIIALAVAAAVVVNLLVYAIGRAAGGSFRFTTDGVVNEVDAVTVAGFSAVPLLVGLIAVALLARFGTWVTRTAAIVATVLAAGTILAMTIPADLDRASTVTLAVCHLTLIPITLMAIQLIRTAAVATRPPARPPADRPPPAGPLAARPASSA